MTLGKDLFATMTRLLEDKHFIQIDSSTKDPEMISFIDAYLKPAGFEAFLACMIQSKGVIKDFLLLACTRPFGMESRRHPVLRPMC
jgi:hypothetical protein